MYGLLINYLIFWYAHLWKKRFFSYSFAYKTDASPASHAIAGRNYYCLETVWANYSITHYEEIYAVPQSFLPKASCVASKGLDSNRK